MQNIQTKPLEMSQRHNTQPQSTSLCKEEMTPGQLLHSQFIQPRELLEQIIEK